MAIAQLYVTLNADMELVLEGDLLGNGRETLVEDVGGPTVWESDPAIDLPERVLELTHQAAVNEFQAGNTVRLLAIEHAVIHQRIADER